MKTPDKRPASEPPPAPQTTAQGCLLRLGWMVAGTMLPVLCLIAIARRPAGFSWVDGAFWAVLAAGLGLRFLDIARGGRTADGQPATMADGRRYALLVLVVGGAAWLAAHGVKWIRG